MSLETLKKLDRVSLKNLTEGEGPCDECICHILSAPRDKCLTAMMKRAIACITCKKRKDKDKKPDSVSKSKSQIKAGAKPSAAGAKPSKAGAKPSKAGVKPSKAGVKPSAAGSKTAVKGSQSAKGRPVDRSKSSGWGRCSRI